jgi:hypothetical protein
MKKPRHKAKAKAGSHQKSATPMSPGADEGNPEHPKDGAQHKARYRPFICNVLKYICASFREPNNLPFHATAIFTFFLAVFTFFLAVFAYRAWDEATRGTKALEGQLTAAQGQMKAAEGQLAALRNDPRPWVSLSSMACTRFG